MLLKEWIEAGRITGQRIQASAGSCIYTSGDLNNGLHYLLEGEAVIISEGGHRRVVYADTLIGLPDMMNKIYTQTLLATSDVLLMHIPIEEMQRSLQFHPPLRLYLVQQMSNHATLTRTSYE